MNESALEPLPLKSLSGKKPEPPFPFENIGTAANPDGQLPADRLRQLEEMLARNQEKTNEIEREAYDKAYIAGEKAGLELGRKRAEQLLVQMQEMLEKCEAELDNLRSSMFEAVVDISGALAEWLIDKITTEDKARLLEMAKKTASSMPDMTDMKIAVHPEDFAHIKTLLDESEDDAPPLIPDPGVKQGSVRIFNKAREALIDPIGAINNGVAHIKTELLANRKHATEHG